MSICTGSATVQRMRCTEEISAAYLGNALIWTSPVSDWLWKSNGSEVTLLLYHGSSNSPTVPQFVEGFPVTVLAPTACNYAGISGISIPTGITALL